MSTIYRDRDRYDDSRTTISSSRRDRDGGRDSGRDGGYTTVKRYIVKDDDTRSNYGRSDRRIFPERGGERVEETRIVRRERDVDEAPAREVRREEPRYSSEQLTIRRDEREDDRRSYYEPRREQRSDDREEIIIRRTTDRDEPRRDDTRRDDLTVARLDDRRESTQIVRKDYRDDYEVLSPTRDRGFEDRDLQKYTRQTDYYAPAPQPQVIIVKQEPIIIRERVRDDDYVSIRRSEVDEEKSIVRRGRTPDPPRQAEEDYFYEKKIRERIDEPREDEWRDRRMMRREVSPHDSVSQVGRRQSRRGSYSSDDSMVYVKRTKEGYSSGEGSPDRKKNLAAGVIAGIGAAELLRNHKKKEGRETASGVGRLGRDVGAGALGAIAAEGIQRARSQYRSRSRRRRSRGRSSSSSSRSRSTRRRSRSESRSKLKTWGAVGLGAAALAAAAAVAQKKMAKNKDESPDRGRSSSRGRKESVAQIANDRDAPSDDARNPKHRNIRMAEAGAAGAAITALIDRARSKSRGGGRDRSRSRVRQAIPVVAAGLGSAALAGLYEKNKAKKEATVIAKEERRERRTSRSRSRQRSEYSDMPPQNQGANPMIEYGDGPMYGNNFGREYYPGNDQYGQPPNQEGYYANQTAVVPAAAGAAAGYGAAQGGRARSLSGDRRSRSRSLSSSPGGHRRRHRHSRSRSGGRDAQAAGGLGAAAMAEQERKERKRERRARKQQAQYGDPYEDTFNPHGYAAPTPPAADPYAANTQPGYYPQTSQFPPPPGTMPQQYPGQPAPAAGAGYPNEFPPPPPGGPSAPGYDAYASGANPYAQPRRGGDENVSVPPNSTFPSDRSVPPDGISTPRGPDPAANPSINIHPPSVSTPTNPYANPDTVPSPSYIPPTDRAPSPQRERAVSQPPPSGPRKSVAFAEKPEVQTVADSEASSPEQHRHRRHRERGYEAGDDTDSTPDDQRRRQRGAETSRSIDPTSAAPDDGQKKRHHRRRRSADPSSAESSLKVPDRNQTLSPADSDATVELPSRFDSKGNRKTEKGDDPLADRLDEIIQGKGATGKLFGNFVNGIFGPEGRKKGKDRDR